MILMVSNTWIWGKLDEWHLDNAIDLTKGLWLLAVDCWPRKKLTPLATVPDTEASLYIRIKYR